MYARCVGSVWVISPGVIARNTLESMDKYLLLWYDINVFYESGSCDMRFSLLPNHITKSLTDVKPEMLQQWGIQLLMLDFDNTIVPYTTNQPTDEMVAYLQALCKADICVCVVSNSRKSRVKQFCAQWGIDCITHAKKPFSKGICACMQKYQLPANCCALVGDQIYTDVLGANCAGVRSILVKAIDNHNFWLKARHVLELPWIFLSRRRHLSMNGNNQ